MSKIKDSDSLEMSRQKAQRVLTLTLLGNRLLNRSRYAAELSKKISQQKQIDDQEIQSAFTVLFSEGDEFDAFGARKLIEKAGRIEELEGHLRQVNRVIRRLETQLIND